MDRIHIDQAEGMPSVDIVGSRCIVTFTVMPTPRGLESIIEVTEAAITASNQLAIANGKAPLTIEYRLPSGGG